MDKVLYTILTFSLSIASGVIGYYLKHLIDQRKSKLLKILNVDLAISRPCVKSLNPNGYLPPRISIQLENLSKTDITIKGILIKNKKQLDILPLRFVGNK